MDIKIDENNTYRALLLFSIRFYNNFEFTICFDLTIGCTNATLPFGNMSFVVFMKGCYIY